MCIHGRHHYEKFNDALIFCIRCGDVRRVGSVGYTWSSPWTWRPVVWTTTAATSNPVSDATSWLLENGVTKDATPKEGPPLPKTPKGKTVKGDIDPPKKI